VRCVKLDEHKLITGGDAKKIIIWDYKVIIHLFVKKLPESHVFTSQLGYYFIFSVFQFHNYTKIIKI
jgi:hypothetical protein